MITETIYEHLKDIYKIPIDSLVEPAVIVEPSYSISKVMNEISKKGSYDVFCKEEKNVLATNVRELLAGKDISGMPVKSFLYHITPISRNDPIQRAANIMAHYRIRAVPVQENNEIVGEVRAKKIVEQLAKKDNKWIKANLIFTSNPITVKSSEPLSTARKIMLSKKIDHLPVINKGVVKQVLTSYHVLQTIIPLEKLGRRSIGMTKVGKLESNIGNIGSTRIPQCGPNDNLNTIIQQLLDTDTTCCLVSLWDNLQGIITYRDILSLLAAKIESEIPLYVVGMPEEQRNVDLITSKFSNTLKRIRKVYSEIQEAKVSIKTHRSGSKNRRGGRYDVSVMITTPHYPPFIFKDAGWDLSQIFDSLNQKMLRKLSKRAKRRFKTSIRKRGWSSLVEPV